MTGTTIQTSLIVLREGLEALLVLTALAAYLGGPDAKGGRSALYLGVAAALLAIAALSWTFEDVFRRVHDSSFEAVALLVIAALMLQISGWLFLSAGGGFWSRYLKTSAAAARREGSRLAVAAIAFVAVFREGVEVMLFVYALSRTVGGWNDAIATGLILGAAALAAFSLVVNRLADRLPLRLAFFLTSVLLFVMALKLIGAGMHGLQINGYLTATAVRHGGWLSVIGFNPSWEAVIAQAAVIAASAVALMTFARRANTVEE